MAVTSVPATGSSGAAAGSAARKDKLGTMDFLKLLTAQLQYQNPLSPTGDTEFLSQMAQFSMLETLQQIGDKVGELGQKFDALAAKQSEAGLAAALNLVGRQVSALTAAGESLSGGVTGVRLKDGLPYLVVGGQEVSLEQLQEVR